MACTVLVCAFTVRTHHPLFLLANRNDTAKCQPALALDWTAGLLLVKAQLYYIILHVQRGSRTVSPLPSLPSLRDLQHGHGMAA